LSRPVAIITGGEGDLASAIRNHLESSEYEVHSPGRTSLDVSESDSVTSYFAGFSKLDLLINAAGIVRDGAFLKMSENYWDDVIDVNLKGTFLCCRAAVKIMAKQRSGHLIQIGSYSAIHPPAGQTNYAAAKAGVIGLTKSLAKEFGKRNIRANCILPGFLETKMTAGMAESAIEAAREKHSLGRFNTIDEAAKFIAFLADSPHISGQVFQLDSRT